MAKLIALLLVCFSVVGQTLSVINTGTTSNDGTGDSLRTAFTKANTNFYQLWSEVFTNIPVDIANASVGKLNATNGTAVNLTGSLTNVSIYGSTVIDTGDELQDTVDYGLALTPNGNTPTENDASPRPRSVATIAALVADVNPLLVPTYARVSVLGYSAAGDGGGGDFRRVLASSGSTNSGTFFQSTSNATYAWQRVIGNGQITSSQWGIATGSDDLAAMQSWVDYAAANNLLAVLADGSYLLTNSLVIPSNLRLSGSYNSVFERAAVSSQTNSHNFSALRTAYTFNPYQTNGGYTGQSVPGLVTNVTLSGFRIKTADNYHSSFGIAAFCAQDWLLENLTVDTMTNHWAVTIYGNKVKVTGCTINNGGSVYQDGLHVIGGDQIVFTGNLVNAGDDALVLSTPWKVQQDISNVTMSGNVANSTHAHAIRMMIEATDGTNHIRNVVVNGLTGSAGQVRNALVRIESDSTNVLYGVTNVSISNVRLYHGGLSGHGGSPVGSAYGYVIHHADNITFTDCHVGGTPYWNYYIENCGNVTLTDCTGSGAEFTSLNATMYVNGVENLTVNGGRYGNANALTADTIWIADAGNVKFNGTWVENSITNRAAVTMFGTAADLLSMVNCTLTNSGGYALTAFTSPAKALVVGNVLNSIQGVVWQAGSPPAGSVVINNVGVTESTVRTGTEYTIQSSGGSYLGGMGSRSSLVRFAATNGTFVFAQDDSGGGTKTARVGGQSSATGTPLAAFVTTDTGTLGTLTLGGSSALMRSPAVVDIANDVNYGSGTSRVRVSTNGVAIEPAGISSSPVASEALAVRDTTRGVMLAKMTAAQFAAIGSKAAGLQGYNSTDNRPIWYNGSADRNAAAIEEVQPATETLTASGGTLTITAGKGPNQSSRWVADGNVTLAFASLADNNGGRLRVWPATTNVTITLPNYASGPSGSTLTVNGGTGSTNYTEIVWVNGVESSTNRVSINALNYYR